MNFYYPVAAISASNDASICCRWRRLVLSLPPLFTTNKYYEIETDSFLVGSAADCRSRGAEQPEWQISETGIPRRMDTNGKQPVSRHSCRAIEANAYQSVERSSRSGNQRDYLSGAP